MQPLDTPVLLSGAEPSVVLGTLLGHDQNWGHQGRCVPGGTFLETTDVDGDPRVGSDPPEMEAQDREGKGLGWSRSRDGGCPACEEQARESSICSTLGQQHIWTFLVPPLALGQMK